MGERQVSKYLGVNYNNLRKALYLLYFGVDEGRCQTFDSPKYKYIIPMQGNFENPVTDLDANDTYVMYWIEEDESLTQDDYYTDEDNKSYSRQKCVAQVLLRFVGAEAEDWVKACRHLVKRGGVGEIFAGTCNAEKLVYTSPIIPRVLDYSGRNSNVAFDIRFKLYYDENIYIGWEPLKGIDLKVTSDIKIEEEMED